MKTLILGDGLLATQIHKLTGWDYISRKKDNINFGIPISYKPDIRKYDQIINCIAYTNTQDNTKQKHWSTNYVGVLDLSDMCNELNKKLIHISTDYVYANSIPFAKETDIPIHYNNWYTYTKLLADSYIEANSNNYLILRSSFKPKPFPWKEAWTTLVGNFDYVDKIAALMISVINSYGLQGIYNIGTELKTMHKLAIKTRPDCIPIAGPKDIRNISMNLSRFKRDVPKIYK